MPNAQNAVRDFCEIHNACSDGRKWAVQHNTLAEVWDKCERGDWMIWMLRQADKVDKPMAMRIAIECAKHVLPFFETKYPKDKRPAEAIQAAADYLENPTEERKALARKAAADASAADASAAAAYAATAASAAAAAYAAAYAATAAADTTDYADAAAYAATRLKERKWQADMIRKVCGNPFEVKR